MDLKKLFARITKPVKQDSKSFYTDIISGSGLKKSDGRMYEEYSFKFKGKNKYKTFDQMANDSTVFQLTKAIELTATGCDYFTQPASDKRKDKAVSEFVWNALTNMPNATWTDFVTEVFSFVKNGYSLFEMSFKQIDANYYPMMWFIDPQSVEKFKLDDGSDGVLQISSYALDRGENEGNTNRAEIPAYKLVQFKFGGYTANYEGESLYRKAGRDRFYKDKMQTFEAIYYENIGVPPLKVIIPNGSKQSEIDTRIKQAQDLRLSDDKICVAEKNTENNNMINDFEFMNMATGATAPNFAVPITRYDQNILDVFFMGFLYLGKSEKGSYGMATTSVEFFLLGVESLIKRMVEVINNYVIPKIVLFNFGDVDCPKLSYQKIQFDLGVWADIISKLTQQGHITDTFETEKAIREKMKMNAITEEQYNEGVRAIPNNNPSANGGQDFNTKEPKATENIDEDKESKASNASKKDNVSDGDEDGPDLSLNHGKIFNAQVGMSNRQKKKLKKFYAEVKPWRPLTFAERKINIPFLKKLGDDALRKLGIAYDSFTKKQLEDIEKQVGKVVESNSYAGIKNINAKYSTQLSKDIEKIYKEAFDGGKNEAARQIGVDPIVTGKATEKAIKEQAEQMAFQISKQAENTTKNVLFEKVSKSAGIKNLEAGAAITAVKKELESMYNKSLTGVDTVTVNGAINTGMGTTYEKNQDQIYGMQYSAIIDGRTTSRCLSLDGIIVKYDSAAYRNYSPPQHFGCRSIWVAILIEESFKPDFTGKVNVPIKNTIASKETLKAPVLGTSNKALQQVEKEIVRRGDKIDQMKDDGASKDAINKQQQEVDSLQKAVDKAE